MITKNHPGKDCGGVGGWSEPSTQKIQQVKALRLDGKEERAAGEGGEDKGRVGQSQLWSGTAT